MYTCGVRESGAVGSGHHGARPYDPPVAVAASGHLGVARPAHPLAGRSRTASADPLQHPPADRRRRGLLPDHPGADRWRDRPHGSAHGHPGAAGLDVLDPEDGGRTGRRGAVRSAGRHPALHLDRTDLVEPGRGDRHLAVPRPGAAPRRPGAGNPDQRHAHPRRDQHRHRRRDPGAEHADRRRRGRRLQPDLSPRDARPAGRPRGDPGGRGRRRAPGCRGRGAGRRPDQPGAGGFLARPVPDRGAPGGGRERFHRGC